MMVHVRRSFQMNCHCSLLIVLCVLYVGTAEDNATYIDMVTQSSNQVTSLMTINTTVLTESVQTAAITTTLAYVYETGEPKADSPWDHITDYFTDFARQVVGLNSEYCGGTCNFNYILASQSKNIYCDECSCSEECQETGDCCPDLVLLHNRTQPSFYPGCIEVDVPVDEFTNFQLMVNWCPASFDTSFIKTMCENPTLTDWPDVVPQINMDTGTSFRNTYCAQCHGQNTNNWATSIICSSFDSTLQDSTSLSGLFNATMRSNTCKAYFEKPSELVKQRCNQRHDVIIERCNVSGLWSIYDKNVDDACNAFSQVIFGMYRNVFCFYCNNQYSWSYILTLTGSSSTRSPLTASLTALIDFDDTLADRYSEHSQSNDDSGGSMVAYLKQCQNRSISCAEGKQLKGDECHSLFASSNMYGYRVCFQINITLTNQLPSTDHIIWLILINVPRVNSTVINISKMTGYVVELENCPDRQMYVTVRYVMFIYSVLTLNRDQFEKQLMEDNTMLLTDSTEHVQYHAACSSISPALAVTLRDPQYCTAHLRKFAVTIPIPITIYESKIADGAKYIQLSKQLNCPRVVLNSSDYVIMSNNETLQFPTLFLLNSDVVMEHGEFQTLDDGSVVVCVSDYLNATSQTIYSCNDKDLVKKTTHLSIFSFVCTSISLLFLAMTFGTYCMFASMRTLGGVCNMGLIATIFAAQALFEYGIEQNEDAIGCQIIGILIHFLWLSAVFWMNACTFLLFLKLSFPIRCINLGYNRNKIFLLSALYSYGASALIVCLNVVINIASRGQVGYGGSLCYLNTNVSQVYLFKVPMGVIVTVNIALFVFTICRISRNKSISSTQESKINLLACVKLSVITGLVWLFSYLYEVFHITAFAYLFTLFVGSQGVLFFLAIVINKTGLSLWNSYCGKRKSNILTGYSNSNNAVSSDSLTVLNTISQDDSSKDDGRRFKSRV